MAVLTKLVGRLGDATGEVAILEYTIDIASVAAATAADTTVTATADVRVGDYVYFLQGPATLGAVTVQGCHSVIADQFKMRVVNGTAAAIDPASGTFTFLRVRP